MLKSCARGDCHAGCVSGDGVDLMVRLVLSKMLLVALLMQLHLNKARWSEMVVHRS